MTAKLIIADLEKRRKSIGISTVYMSKVANVTTATYRNWREGKTVPPYDSLIAMKDAIEAAEKRLAPEERGDAA